MPRGSVGNGSRRVSGAFRRPVDHLGQAGLPAVRHRLMQDTPLHGAVQLGSHVTHKCRIGRLFLGSLQKGLQLGLDREVALLVSQVRVDTLYRRFVTRHSFLRVTSSFDAGKCKPLEYRRITPLSTAQASPACYTRADAPASSKI